MLKAGYRFFSMKILSFLAVAISAAFLSGCGSAEKREVLRVAMPYSDNITDPGGNYYVEWLKNRSGLDIEPVIIRQRKCSEYLDALFFQKNDIDIVMFGEDFVISPEELEIYADSGFLEEREDGSFYYPNYGRESVGDCGQILWINSEWLGTLGLKVPQTTQELKEVLTAFRDMDPNGNGIRDEIPLLSCDQDNSLRASEIMLESFIYNDPYNGRQFIRDGQVADAALTPEFAAGTDFVKELKKEMLLIGEDEQYTYAAFTELVNSPDDMVGAFTCGSLSEVIYQGNPEILARFMHVAPLMGPDGVRNALYVDYKPEVGAVICRDSAHKEEAEKLLDIMLTKEASLIARYGEEGVDWEYSDGTDVSIYGMPSTIVTRNYIWNTPQNKHLNGIGPMNVPVEYLKGVTWNGVNSDFEYIDARAQMSYAAFLPERSVTMSGRQKEEEP